MTLSKRSGAMDDTSQLDKPLTIVLGHDEILIRRRYETASIANDFLIAPDSNRTFIP